MSTPLCPSLCLFAKWPQPGLVKTRLATVHGSEFAAAASRAFLLDTMERCSVLDLRRVLVFSPSNAAAAFAELAQGRFHLLPQSEGDLGQRLQTCYRQQIADGVPGVIFIGADSPTLPIAYLEQAVSALASHDVVLGPATDGGYYLLGCGSREPPIFEGMPWSGHRVLTETVARLHAASWRLALLPPWYDVDTAADWDMLRGHVAALRRAGVDPRIPHTEALLLQ